MNKSNEIARVSIPSQPHLDAVTIESLREIMVSEEKAEAFVETLQHELDTDDESYRKKGFYMAKAILANNISDLFVAYCGWSLETLLERVNQRFEERKTTTIDPETE